MSSRIPGKKNAGLGQGDGRTTKPLEITVAIKNKETGKWETARLNEKESQDIKRAIEAIRLLGTQAGLGVWNVFDKDGTVLEMSHEGVFVKEGPKWRDLLDDKTAEPIRGRVRRTLTAVTGILGKKGNSEGASGEVALNAAELNQGNVIIQVKVVPQTPLFQSKVSEGVKEGLDAERAFNQKVAETLIAFNNPVFLEDLKDRGWSDREIQEHKSALKTLKYQSDQVIRIFEDTLSKLQTGNIKGGVDYLCAQMQKHYPSYVRACCKLVIPQKVAKGRSLTEPRIPFMVDLEHGLSHAAILETLFSAVKERSDSELKKAVEEGTWPKALGAMLSEAEKLRAELTFVPLVASLNYNHQLNQEFAHRMNTFVGTFQENRDQFEETMRAQGITDLESAFIFNHYVPFSAILNQWNQRVQTVVDLANKKEYQAALEEYTTVMEDLHPTLTDQVRTIYLTLKSLKDTAVETALRAFAGLVGLFNPSQVLADLSAERAAIKQQLMYTEAVEKAKKTGIALPTRVEMTLQEIKERIEAAEAPEESRLFTISSKFMLLFNFGGLMQIGHPLHRVWNRILKKYNWRLETIEQFTNLMNDYAELIRPFKQAMLAIDNEKDPIKKVALQRELSKLAEAHLSELRVLQKEFARLGGTKQLLTLLSAAQEFKEAPELKTPKRQAAAQKLQAEAQAQVQLMEDRLAFINQMFSNLL